MSDDKRPVLTRRDFVRGTAGTVLTASMLGPAHFLRAQTADSTEATARTRSSVVVVREQGVQNDAKEIDSDLLNSMLSSTVVGVTGAATAAEGWAGLFGPDDVVGIVKSDFMNHTHGELIKLVMASLLAVGVPREQILDVQRDNAGVKKCTALICMPALKAHWLTGIGTVLKNYIMFSGKPADYHRDDSANLAEIWQMDHVKGKTRLVLVDALRPMCSKGPQPDPRYRWNYNGLVAGTDPVAVEAVCVQILENKRAAIREEPWPLAPPPVCIEAAEATFGLGIADLERIDVQAIGWDEEQLLG